MVVTLIGMKHCGKSTLGAALAARWQCPFYDVDRLIEERYACETGQRLSVREIFARCGENRFAELETQVVYELYLRLHDGNKSAVIAVGGRTPLNPRVKQLLPAMSTVVYLELSAAEALRRVMQTGLPAFVDEAEPTRHFHQLYEQRVPCYRRLAHLTVNVDALEPAAAVEKLIAALAAINVGCAAAESKTAADAPTKRCSLP